MSHISRSCANAPGWPEEKSGGLRYNDWPIPEVAWVGSIYLTRSEGEQFGWRPTGREPGIG